MNTNEILSRFPELSVLVVGDICLDRWCRYDPAEADISRETGIPRIGVVETQITAGAGGTVANNLAALGAGRIAVLGAVGQDGFGFELKQALAGRGVEALLVESPAVQTFTYTKLLNADTGQEDLPRVDFINAKTLPGSVQSDVLALLRSQAPEFDIVVVSDQAETEDGGVVTAALRRHLAELAVSDPWKVVWADSRLRSELFRNVVVKPNQEEAETACQRLFGRVDFPALRQHINTPALLVTHGPRGVLVIEDGSEQWIATQAVEEPVDICGAGDSFTAGAALTLAATGSALQAAQIGNLVASITIMKKGTGTATPAEVLAAGERWDQ
jgi:rfaE bifunctional protein kinase chain/domain